MAMHAREIAKLADIDLKDFRARAANHHIFLSKSGSKSVHEWKDFVTQ